VNSDREPALPKPLPRSVSPCDDRGCVSIGTPNGVDGQLARGCDALAHGLRRREDLDAPSGVTVTLHGLLEGVAAGPLEERGDAAAAELPAGLATPQRAPRSPFQSASARRLVEDLLELAAVVGLAHRRSCRA
jgi:hypothetical protein